MITTKRSGTDDYTQVGFIEAKDNQGNYQNIDKIYDNQGNIVFQQGYLNEYQGADDFGIPAIGKPLVDYTIWGNSLQNGTPTPDNPIEPEFCGERTENLFDVHGDMDSGHYCDDNGNIAPYTNVAYFYEYIKIDTTKPLYIYNAHDGINLVRFYYYTTNKEWISRSFALLNATPITPPTGTEYIRLQISTEKEYQYIMITQNPVDPQTFIPYGYKIPISSAGQTKTIYLGQVPTTRRIKKLVLTGEERTVGGTELTTFFYGIDPPALRTVENITVASNCYIQEKNMNPALIYRHPDYTICFTSGSTPAPLNAYSLAINDGRFDYYHQADFMNYLKERYESGNPVVVWYVMYEPEVGIFNEPLAKIGDYADSVDFSQAGVEIPTLKKPNTTVIDVETEVEPSEVDITYRGSTKPKYNLFLAKNGDSFEAKDGQSLYIGGNP